MAIEDRDKLLSEFMQFFKDYQSDDGDFTYVEQINRLIRDGERSLDIDYEDLVLMGDTHELDLASTMIELPLLMIDVGGEALAEMIKLENQDYYREVILRQDEFHVRFKGIPSSMQIRDIRSSHVDSIRALDGIVIRTTEIKSIITRAVFYCAEGHTQTFTFADGVYQRPERCIIDTCKERSFVLDEKESKMIDWQSITLQEKPEDLPPAASPKAISCRLLDDLVNAVRPGDRINLSGIIRTQPSKQIKKGTILTYDTWVDVNFVESESQEEELTMISPEDRQYFLELAQDPKIHEILLKSVAPAIHGLEKIKEATLLMLFAGVDKQFPDGFSTRGQPNILLVGDPGVAKSQLLRYIKNIAPRGLYTSGKGASAAGLTAAVIRDPDTGEITLEAGALVLADRGVCMIDEFDKMNDNDRSAIHEAMEQHTVSIAKAGIVATLNSRTGVLAAANPKYGRYEAHRTFSENVTLSPAILSRFDLIFLMRDEPNEEKDGVLAKHILDLHRYHGSTQMEAPPLDEEKLKKYISFAKQNYNPILTEETTEMLSDYYVNLRNTVGKTTEAGRVTITARQLEGIIRLAEARARASLRTQVTKQDANKAIELVNYSLSQIAIDPETGQADIDALYSGQTRSKRSDMVKLLNVIDFLSRKHGGNFEEEELYKEAIQEGLSKEYIEGMIQQMRRDGSLYQPKSGMLARP